MDLCPKVRKTQCENYGILLSHIFSAWTGVKEEKSELYEEEHLKRLHRKNTKENYCGPWQCYVCGKIHDTVILVNDHITKTHFPIVKSSMFGPPRDHQCEKCQIVFKSHEILILHACGNLPPTWMGEKRNSDRKCPHCPEIFTKNYPLLRHIAVKHSEKKFACDKCDYKATLPTLLAKHQQRLHPEEERTRDHLCQQCGKFFREKTHLWSHINYSHGKSIEECMCYTCGAIIKTDAGLIKHLKEVHGKDVNRSPTKNLRENESQPFKCETCGKEFDEFEQIRAHFKAEHKDLKVSHKIPPRHTCEDCGKKFHNKIQLESHTNRVHIKEKKYPCTRCEESFYDPRALKLHLDQHDGLSLYKCNVCWKTFKSKFLCERHFKTVHEKNEIYCCTTCGFKTYHQHSLTTHIQQVHQKIKPHKCDFCDSAFFYKRDKLKHIAKNHGKSENW